MLPLLPLLAVPELSVRPPLTPADAALADDTTTEPDEEDALAPLLMVTLPPKLLCEEAPAVNRTEPPVLTAEPAVKLSFPPVPDVLPPTIRLIEPLDPAVDTPDWMEIAPEFPLAAEPVLNVKAPLTPAYAAFDDATVIAPVEDDVLLPPVILTAPPVADNELPADNTKAPPAEDVLDEPAYTYVLPPTPPADVPGEMAIGPDTAVALPVVMDTAPEEPVVAVPDCTNRFPLLVPPFEDARSSAPEPRVPVPDTRFTDPPVLANACPANTEKAPPSPVVAIPTDKEIKPEV